MLTAEEWRSVLGVIDVKPGEDVRIALTPRKVWFQSVYKYMGDVVLSSICCEVFTEKGIVIMVDFIKHNAASNQVHRGKI